MGDFERIFPVPYDNTNNTNTKKQNDPNIKYHN